MLWWWHSRAGGFGCSSGCLWLALGARGVCRVLCVHGGVCVCCHAVCAQPMQNSAVLYHLAFSCAQGWILTLTAHTQLGSAHSSAVLPACTRAREDFTFPAAGRPINQLIRVGWDMGNALNLRQVEYRTDSLCKLGNKNPKSVKFLFMQEEFSHCAFKKKKIRELFCPQRIAGF